MAAEPVAFSIADFGVSNVLAASIGRLSERAALSSGALLNVVWRPPDGREHAQRRRVPQLLSSVT